MSIVALLTLSACTVDTSNTITGEIGTSTLSAITGATGIWAWTKQLGESAQTTEAAAMVTDLTGNTYVTGYTTANLVSCNGVSAGCSGTSRGTYDYFITKYNSSGSWLWTKQLGETGQQTQASGIALDINNNVLVTGSTQGNLPSCGGISANCAGTFNGVAYFVSKYNSSGSWIWTKELGQSGVGADGNAIATDQNSNVYVTGTTFGNLPGCNGVSGGCGGGGSAGFWDYFVSKYNSSGSWQWTKQLGIKGGFYTTETQGITTDQNGNVYVVGNTAGDIASANGVSANGNGNSTWTNDYFITKYSTSGTWQWTKQLDGATGGGTANAIVCDQTGGIYIAGNTADNIVSCSGISANCSGASQGTDDYYIEKLDYNGTYQWGLQLGQTGGTAQANALSVDANGNIAVGGSMISGNLASCNGISANCTGSAQGAQDYFISKYNSSGTWQWTQQLGETAISNYILGIGTDLTGNIYAAGYTAGNLLTCNGISVDCTGAAAGVQDFFVTNYH